MGSLQRVAAYLGAFAAISWVMVVLSVAQSADLPAAAPSDLRAAGSEADPGVNKDANKSSKKDADLGDRLSRSSGVIRPPAGVDPGLTQAPPQTGSSRMPVIPPPGSAGGEIDPK